MPQDRTERRKRTSGKTRLFSHKMQKNLKFVFCVILLCILVLCGRIIFLIQTKGDTYEKAILSRQKGSVNTNLPYKRGEILDRNGVVLAKSQKVYNVILDPSITSTEEVYVEVTVQALSEVFGLEEAYLKNLMTEKKDSAYVRLLKKQDYEKKNAFEELAAQNKRIKGVWFEEEYERQYPYGSLASHVIGYTVGGDIGTWGIEQYYNNELIGVNGREYGYYDSELNLVKVSNAPEDGNSIISTIDVNVQRIVEKKIREFDEAWDYENIGVIVMNPNNGEILSMASNKGFDLNHPRDLSEYYSEVEIASMTEEEQLAALNKMWRNFCISDTYEPGSTFKPFTVAAALEEAVIKKDDCYVCNGYRMVDRWRINCNNRSGHGTLTLTEAIMKSCNPALMTIGEELGKEAFYRYQRDFQFGDKTGVDLPGEGNSILVDFAHLNVTELATSSFGQSFNISMILMASAFCSLINGGTYYQPHVVREINNASGATVYSTEGVKVTETISSATSEFLRDALYMTVEKGTAKPAKVEGYLIGGKTGTAQKGIRSEKKYVVSFIGCAPADHPEVMIYVVIDEVHDEEKKASSSLATALTSEILSEALPFLSIYPEGEIDYHVDMTLLNPETNPDDLQEGDIITEEAE